MSAPPPKLEDIYGEHLLYETACEEARDMIPKALPKTACVPLSILAELITIGWIRGAEWAAANPELATHALIDHLARAVAKVKAGK